MPLPLDKETSQRGANREPTGFLAWAQRFSRFLHSGRRQLEELKIQREIRRIERARRKEKNALTEQRRFYERLFKRINVGKAKPHYPPAAAISPKPKTSAEHSATPPAPVPNIAETPTPISTPPQIPIPIPEPLPPVAPVIPAASKSAVSSFSETPAKPPRRRVPVQHTNGFFHRMFARSLAKKLATERQEEELWHDKNEVEKRFWQPYHGVKPNLIKDQGVVFFNWQEHLLILALSLVMCCLTIALVYVGLLVWHKERLDNNRAAIANFKVINDEIAKSETELQEVVVFNNKLSLVSDLLANHVYWTNFFSLLEDTTLKDVYYQKFSGDLTGIYAIPSVAKNIETISLQLDVMKASDKVKSVTYDTGAGQGATQTVKFNLGMSVDPKVFLK